MNRSKLKLVVIRQLPHNRPAVQTVINAPESECDSLESMKEWMMDVAKDNVDKFKERFPEFKDAEYYFDFIESEDTY